MWNNLRSDVYRLLHTKFFYAITILLMLIYAMILMDAGVVSNTGFATFDRSENTFVQYLLYLPKSGILISLALLCIGLFACDEYNNGFEKNIYPLNARKWTIVVERYFFAILVISLLLGVLLVEAFLIQAISPIPFGSLLMTDYIIYLCMQILLLAVIASLVMMLVHASKSRVLAVLLSLGYGMEIIYMILSFLCQFLFKNIDMLKYTVYVVSGKLPYNFSIDGYTIAFLVFVGFTLLYNGISYIILKKKDL